MHILDLPYDVWATILQLAPRRDVLHLAKASHAAYDLAVVSLLSEVDLSSRYHQLMGLNLGGVVYDEDDLTSPSGPERVTSFSTFILRDDGRNAQYIRSLIIRDTAFSCRPEGSCAPKNDYTSCTLLVDAVTHARNLRHLHIERLETLLEKTPPLATIISGFHQLESISFRAVGRLSLPVLRNMQSTPRKIDLREVDKLPLTDILNSLEMCASSLEVLTVRNHGDPTLDVYSTVWERVHTLDLIPIHPFSLPPLPALVRAFPNVRLAHLGNFVRGRGVPEWMLPLFPDWGLANSQTPSARDSRPVRWPNLDSLKIYAPIPLLIPPVRRLLYRHTIGMHESADDVSRALEAIREIAPVVLSVWMGGYPDAFLKSLSSTIESVRFLQLSQDRSPANHEELKGYLPNLLRPILESANLPPLLGISIAHNRRWPGSVQEMDFFRETATAVVRRCPSMRFVGFYQRTRHLSHEDMRWYRVCAQSDEDSPVVEAIPPFEVPAVVSYLENLDRSVV